MSSPTNPYASPKLTEFQGPSGPLGPATYSRFGVIGFTVAMSFLLYLDRFALSAAGKDLSEDLQIDKIGFGWVNGAFFAAYALCQVPAGWISDRFGGRITLTICVAGWSLALMGMAWVDGLVGLLIFRVILGIFQAPAYPAAGGYVKEWMPLSSRGFANGSTAMAGRMGGVVTNAATPFLMTIFATSLMLSQTWRHVFTLYGGLGLLWCVAFWTWFRDRPAEHAGCNAAERDLISSGQPPASAEPPPLPILSMLTNRSVWLLSGVNFFSNIGWIFLATWLPTYLTDEHGMSRQTAGVLTAIAAGTGMLGCILGGFTSDFVIAKLGLYWGRKALPLCTMGCAVVLYAVGSQLTDVWALITVFTCVSFLIDFELSSRWGACQDIGGKYTATVLGFGNMCGNLAAAIFPVLIGYLAEAKRWPAVFLISTAALACVWLCWLFFDSYATIMPEDAPLEKKRGA